MAEPSKPIRVAVVGSRGITTINLEEFLPPNCCLIVSGGARGVDTIAENYAKEHGIPTMIIRPDYDRFGRGAPLLRNRTIVDNADFVLAFWDGVSRGTKYTIDYAKEVGKSYRVYVPKKKEE